MPLSNEGVIFTLLFQFLFTKGDPYRLQFSIIYPWWILNYSLTTCPQLIAVTLNSLPVQDLFKWQNDNLPLDFASRNASSFDFTRALCKSVASLLLLCTSTPIKIGGKTQNDSFSRGKNCTQIARAWSSMTCTLNLPRKWLFVSLPRPPGVFTERRTRGENLQGRESTKSNSRDFQVHFVGSCLGIYHRWLNARDLVVERFVISSQETVCSLNGSRFF